MLPNGNFSPVFKLKSGCIAYYPRINFTFSCNSTVFKITKGYVPRSDHLSTWRCRFVTNSLPVQNLFSESSKLIVQVPIHNVTMTVPNGNLIYVIENKRSTFICNTSEGYPEAKISWFINSKTPYNTTDEKEVTKDSSQLSDQNKYPFSVESKLQLYPSKNYNGTRIYCKASNVGNKVPVTSGRKPLLYVQYPPTSPHFYIDSLHVPVENVSVILNNTISVFCESNSDPKSKYAWTLPNRTDIQTNVLTFGNVQKEDDGKYCCMAENWIKTPDGNITKRTNESYIQLSVLFPPENPSLYYHEANGVMNIKSLPLKVVKGDSIKISCNSTGNPQPHSQWDGHGNDNEIKYTSIEKNRTILCKATNQMNDTLGNVTHGTSETNLTIHVMYPPTEPTLLFSTDTIPEMRVSKPLRIIENSTFTLRCLGHSDPYPSYHWTNQSVVNNSLIINNTQRHQSRHFTCNVKNVMNRTFGRQEQGTNSTSISVDVLCK
ncbi:hemicentin-1-like [Mercenaria mercenaria]|uniref:hemicentin-1-like n=1 Tax=Mercenaria mercenaria TaxID=6596 RepID=UPI00234E5C2E|nr:hemicentin-1-like [Mercenaria mercenaria]